MSNEVTINCDNERRTACGKQFSNLARRQDGRTKEIRLLGEYHEVITYMELGKTDCLLSPVFIIFRDDQL